MELHPEEAEYAEWIKGQQEAVQELGVALQLGGEAQVEEIVERASQRYQRYFRASRSSFRRSFSLNSSPLISPLEQAFMWFGGMRPSLSFQLIYGLAGHQIQAELEELPEEVGDDSGPASFASISALQLGQLSELQTLTMEEEDTVERRMAQVQESAADHRPLLQFLGTGASSSSAHLDEGTQTSRSSMEIHLRRKITVLEEICMQADLLRLSTFYRVSDILHNPHLKLHYLLAIAKLQVALHHVGHLKEGPAAR